MDSVACSIIHPVTLRTAPKPYKGAFHNHSSAPTDLTFTSLICMLKLCISKFFITISKYMCQITLKNVCLVHVLGAGMSR